MNKHLLSACLIMTLFCNCSQNKELEQDQQKIEILCEELGISKTTYDLLIIVPVEGCSGCKNKVLQFATDGNSGYHIVYVATGYGNKSLVFNLDEAFLFAENLFTDNTGRALSMGLVYSFPTLYLFNKQKLIKKVEMNAINIDRILNDLNAK